VSGLNTWTYENYVIKITSKNEKDLSHVPASPASIAWTSSALTSSLQSLDILPPERAPTIGLPFCLDGKRKEHVLLKKL
jgi:hypothetical protein